MFKKNLAFLWVLFSAIFIFSGAARAQESATESSLTRIALPAGAERVAPENIPASITEGFDKVMPADGSVVKGDTELLVWSGAGYKMANAPVLVSQISGALKAAGWQYSVAREENGITVFTLIKQSEPRRAIIGYHGATKEALVLTWMELLPANGNSSQYDAQTERQPVQNSVSGGSILGSWSDGYASMLAGYTPTNGPKSYTPGRSHVFKYTFHADGTFDFTGLMEFTEYGCSTAYFQDKRGRYAINGNRLTLTLTKNFWRQHNSCAASGNKEIYHKLDPETYTFNVRRNKSGKDEVCLNSGEGDACFERSEK